MALFNKPQKQMVMDLLIQENPGLAGAVLGVNVEFVGLPVSIGNSMVKVVLRGIRGAGFTGVRAFTYRRIHIATLFSNTTCLIQKFVATTSLDLIVPINERYGLTLDASEMVSFAIGASATSGNITIAVGTDKSFVYEGTINCVWTRGIKQITEYYPQRDLTAVSLPDVMLKAFQMDFSDILTTLQAHDTTVGFSLASSTAVAIVAALKAKLAMPLTLGSTLVPGSDPYDLSGFTLSFTTPDVLQDSNPSYRRVALLSPPAVYGNQYSPIYLHVDKITKMATEDLVSVTQLPGLEPPTK